MSLISLRAPSSREKRRIKEQRTVKNTTRMSAFFPNAHARGDFIANLRRTTEKKTNSPDRCIAAPRKPRLPIYIASFAALQKHAGIFAVSRKLLAAVGKLRMNAVSVRGAEFALASSSVLTEEEPSTRRAR
jgi:hypothetical protein